MVLALVISSDAHAQRADDCVWSGERVENEAVILRAIYSMASETGDINFANHDAQRLMTVTCERGVVMLEFHNGRAELTRTFTATGGAYVGSYEQLPGVDNDGRVAAFVARFNSIVGNGVRFVPALYIAIDEAASALQGDGQMYFLGVVDNDRGMISFVRVILDRSGAVDSVHLAGAGSAHNFCTGSHRSDRWARGISCARDWVRLDP